MNSKSHLQKLYHSDRKGKIAGGKGHIFWTTKVAMGTPQLATKTVRRGRRSVSWVDSSFPK